MSRFVVLSLLVHALALGVPAMHSESKLRWEAPPLHITLYAAPAVQTDSKSAGHAGFTREAANHRPFPSNPPGHSDSGETSAPQPQAPPASLQANHLRALINEQLAAYFVYPPLAQRHGWQGRVRMGLCIHPDGTLSELRVVQSSGYAVLDDDAAQTLQRIGFIPQVRGAISKPTTLELPVIYRLVEG